MAISVNLGGVGYSVPEPGDAQWAANLTTYLVALATAFPQIGGQVGFSALTSTTANPAASGQVRLAKTDTVKYRNNANTLDLALGLDTLDDLTFNSVQITGQPYLAAHVLSTVAGISTATTIIFGSKDVDTDNGYNAATGVYTVPANKGGQYLIVVSVATAQATATGQQVLSISAGGNNVAFGGSNQPVAVGSMAVNASAIVSLTAGAQIFASLSTNGGTCSYLASTASALYIKRLV